MRRRRRPRVVWLPLQQADSVRADQLSSLKQGELPVDVATPGNGGHIEFPIVSDGIGQGQDPLVVTNSLADIERSGYRLRRVVGKIFIFYPASSVINIGLGGVVAVTAGLMVRREDNLTGLSLAATAGTQEFAVDATRNIMDPWAWRRTWIVGDPGENFIRPNSNPFTAISQNAAATQFVNTGIPGTNFGHGPALGDGPHIDAKTARIVGPEERLFLDFTARCLMGNASTVSNVVNIQIAFDVRILASMRSTVGNRKNANR